MGNTSDIQTKHWSWQFGRSTESGGFKVLSAENGVVGTAEIVIVPQTGVRNGICDVHTAQVYPTHRSFSNNERKSCCQQRHLQRPRHAFAWQEIHTASTETIRLDSLFALGIAASCLHTCISAHITVITFRCWIFRFLVFLIFFLYTWTRDECVS